MTLRTALTLVLPFCACLLAPLTLSAGEAGSALPVEVWAGRLETGSGSLRLELHVTGTNEERHAELISVDQGGARLTVDEFSIIDGVMTFAIDRIGAHFRGTLNTNGTVAEGTWTQGGNQLPLTLERTDEASSAAAAQETLQEAWVGTLDAGSAELVVQARRVETPGGTRKTYFDSITQGVRGLNAAWSTGDRTVRITVPRVQGTFEGTLSEDSTMLEGTWRQGGTELPLTLRRQSEEYETSDVWEKRPQRPKPPFPYEAVEVTFTNAAADVTLAGTLTVPEGPGPHPAAVLISGSGPQDRDETLMQHKPFLVLADYLSRRGVAVLRYDDRGFGASTGAFAGATTEDFARDASAAVDFLQAHEAIEPERIGLVGHSEGGLVAPLVAAARDDVAFIVLMAAPGVDGATVLRSAAAAISHANGTDARSIEIQDHLLQAVFDAATRTETPEAVGPAVQQAIDEAVAALPEEQRAVARQVREELRAAREQLATPWFRFFLRYNPYRTLTRVSCPVLAISGDRDVQVVAEINVPSIEQALAEAGNEASEVVVLKGLNHLFQQSQTGAMAEYATIDETINPRALKAIGDWIAAIQEPTRH